MAKGSGDLPSGRRTHRAKPYDANNSFVKKVATKVTDLIPQRSWISKWFNNSQDNGEVIGDADNDEYNQDDEILQTPPNKRPCIRLDVTHPPGTFNIQPRNKESTKECFNRHNDTAEDFLEPPAAGPSGIRRLVASTPAVPSIQNDLNSLGMAQNNGRDDDNSESSESTSGCSSLIPQNNRQEAPSSIIYNSPFSTKKIFMDDKFRRTNHLQSPRCLFLDNSNVRDTLSSRRPSFNASVANSSMERSISSPFYSGNTTFGGANAANLYRRSRTLFNNSNALELKVPRRTNVQVTPSINTSIDTTGMSQTAKRILEALEQFSSPVSDAKKIPVKSLNNTSLSTTNKKRSREENSPTSRVGMRHMTRELSVPTVPDMLRIRRRQRLQDTTLAARKISDRNVPTSDPQKYQLRTDDSNNDTKAERGRKARLKRNLEDEETVEPLSLPNIALPITTLPKFDIALPQYTKPVDKAVEKPASFKFASPITLTDSVKNFQSINHFTFSNPINPKSDKSFQETNELSKTLSIQSNDSSFNQSNAPMPNFIWTGSSNLTLQPKEKKEESMNGPTVVKPMKTGSTLDGIRKTLSNKKGNVWECNECLIKNNNDEEQCVACKASKPSSKAKVTITVSDNDEPKKSLEAKTKVNCVDCKSPSNDSQKRPISDAKCSEAKKISTDSVKAVNPPSKPDFDKFKMPKTSWECPCCMVRNSEATTTCPCCNTLKPGKSNNETKKQPEPEIGFGDKFKKAAGTWSCDTCMVQNKPEAAKCAACETPRANGFGDKFKKPEGSWSCTSCMVQNKLESTKCVACETAKPEGFGNKFKKPEGSWSCDTCMVQNKSESNKCVACETPKPGSKPSLPSSVTPKPQFSFGMPAKDSGFKFGIDKSEEKDKAAPANGFNFGTNTAAVKTGFSFGIPKDDKEKSSTTAFAVKESKTEVPAMPKEEKTPMFSFGAQKTPDTKGFSLGAAQTPASVPTFSFGAQTPVAAAPKEPAKIDKISTEGTNPLKSTETAKTTVTDKNANPPSFLTNISAESVTTVPLAFKSPVVSPPKTETPTINSTPFNFTSQTANPVSQESTVPSFGAPSKPVAATPTFSFGATKAPEVAQVAEEKPAMPFFKPSTAPAFGSSIFGNADAAATTFAPPTQPEVKTSVFNAAPKMPGFGESAESTVPTFGAIENKAPSVFPGTSVVLNGPATSSVFGSPAPSFGAAASSPGIFTPKSETPVPAPTLAPTPTPAPTPAPTPGLFSFGASQPATAPTGGTGFNFNAGSNASAAMDKKPLFSFGAATPSLPPGNGFGSGSLSAPVAPAPGGLNFTFNAPKTEAPPSFGQPSAAASSLFGAPQPTPTPTPSFQPSVPATGNFNYTPPTPSGGFNFGVAAVPPPAPGGFNFNVAGTSPGVAFDPLARPSFNFTRGAVPSFNAAPSVPGRKIKRAVRRVNPQR